MKFSASQAIVFGIILWIIGAFIHESLKIGRNQTAVIAVNHVGVPTSQTSPVGVPTPQAVPISVSASQTTPVISKPKIWPDGAMPTKVVHIPEPQQPIQGLMVVTLNQGDDIELDFDPSWLFNTVGPDSVSGLEISINSGNGFQTYQEYQRISSEIGYDAWWSKPRVVRMRLASSRPDATYRFSVVKRTTGMPMNSLPPQNLYHPVITEPRYHGSVPHKIIRYYGGN
jgi:hypothetical protein